MFPSVISHTDQTRQSLLADAQEESARRWFLLSATLLVAVGTLMVYSSSMTSRPSEHEQVYLSRHLCFLAAGFLVATVCAQLPATFWRRMAPLLFTGTVLLLVLVMIPGIGTRVNGAQRWIRMAGISVQPSETAKLTIPLLLAALLAKRERGYFGEIVKLLAPVAIACVLIAQEPDLGTATFVAITAGIVLFLSRWPMRNFLIGGLAMFPALLVLVALKPYQLERIEGFIAVWRDFAQAPYQIRQSLTTLGAGGLWGSGLGTGWQKLSFLPEANTDFVFAVVGEELGLAGTLVIVVLWLTLLHNGLKLFERLPKDSFATIVGTTLLTQLVLQAAINVAVVTAMVPPKGISHPFISYGGSNLLVSLAAIGIVLGLSSPQPVAPVEIDDEESDDEFDEEELEFDDSEVVSPLT